MADPSQIAARLTEKQRSALFWLPSDGAWSETRAYWVIAATLVAMERRDSPLAEAKIVGINGAGNDLRHRLTPLGLAVRSHLKGQQQ